MAPSKIPVLPTQLIVKFSGLDFAVDGTDLIVRVPVDYIERPTHCMFVSDEIREWSQDQRIPESAYSDAYQSAQNAFFESLEASQVLTYLRNHSDLRPSNNE